MTSKLKDFLYVGAMQGHSIIHDDGMNSKQYSSLPDQQEIRKWSDRFQTQVELLKILRLKMWITVSTTRGRCIPQ